MKLRKNFLLTRDSRSSFLPSFCPVTLLDLYGVGVVRGLCILQSGCNLESHSRCLDEYNDCVLGLGKVLTGLKEDSKRSFTKSPRVLSQDGWWGVKGTLETRVRNGVLWWRRCRHGIVTLVVETGPGLGTPQRVRVREKRPTRSCRPDRVLFNLSFPCAR